MGSECRLDPTPTRISKYFIPLILGFSFANMTILFFFRFLLETWLMSVILPLVLTTAYFFLFRSLIEKFISVISKFDRKIVYLIIASSLLVATVLYIFSPIKITGNLLLLSNAPLTIYRISRAFNIANFFLVSVFIFIVTLTGTVSQVKHGQIWQVIIILFFTFLILIGLFIYDDYGVSSDEPNERTTGKVNVHYVLDFVVDDFTGQDPYIERLSTYRYRNYGVGFQLPVTLIEYNLPVSDQITWQFRHLTTFLLFYYGVLAFYHFSSALFTDERYGILGALLLVSTPRIFAHGFFNAKDATFLAAFAIGLYFSFRFWQKPSIWNGLFAGASIAFAANIRIIAVSLLIVTIGVFILDLFNHKKNPGWPSLGILTTTFFVFLIALWPASWEEPLRFIYQSIVLFSDYRYWDFRVMYLGEFIRGANSPWHYLPVWMLITIPLTYLVSFFFGLIYLVKQSIKAKINLFFDHELRTLLIAFGLMIIPIIMAIHLNSTLYNGWRHFYFVYIPFLLISVAGVRFLVTEFKHGLHHQIYALITLLFLLIFTLNIGYSIFWMIRYHPHQTVYFNAIGRMIGRENFERDYWRLSMKQGLEYLLANEEDDYFLICSEEQFGNRDYYLNFPRQDLERFSFITDAEYQHLCDFSINTYRTPDMFTCENHYHTIIVDGFPILTIDRCGD